MTDTVEQMKIADAIKQKVNVLADFGILISMIPNGYFANCRSKRDIDIRGNELIAKKLYLYDKTHA